MATFSDLQLTAIIKGAAVFIDYPFPGESMEGVSVSVRCLSEVELDGCRIEAQAALRKYAKARGWDAESFVNIDPEMHGQLIKRSIVARAFYDADTTNKEDVSPIPFFTGEEQVGVLGSVVCERLFEIYLEHQEFTNPRRTLTKEQVDELVDSLGKGQASVEALSGFERSTLAILCISLASKVRST